MQVLNHITTTQDLLAHTADNKIILFTNLRRIVLHSIHVPSIPGEDILKFVFSRIKDGFPISILDITRSREDANSHAITRLRSIPSLKVKFHLNVVRDVEDNGH